MVKVPENRVEPFEMVLSELLQGSELWKVAHREIRLLALVAAVTVRYA